MVQGISTQLGNPKALLYWTALFPQFLDRTHALLPQFFLLGISAICVETIVLTGYALATISAQRSRKVMERIGMTYSPTDDFQHPLLPEGHPLRYHVLYRLARPVL